MKFQANIEAFLAGGPHAVVGASRDRTKIGNRVLQAYLQAGRPVYPINPAAPDIDGFLTYADLASVPEPIHGLSVVTPPKVSEAIVEQAGALSVKHIWFQPGAESEQAIVRAMEFGMNVISGGPCILAVLGYSEKKTMVRPVAVASSCSVG